MRDEATGSEAVVVPGLFTDEFRARAEAHDAAVKRFAAGVAAEVAASPAAAAQREAVERFAAATAMSPRHLAQTEFDAAAVQMRDATLAFKAAQKRYTEAITALSRIAAPEPTP